MKRSFFTNKNLFFYPFVMVILVCITFVIFTRNQAAYRQTIIRQWQQQLKITTSIAANNLENFISQFSENLIVVAKDPVIKAKSCDRMSPYLDQGYCPLYNLYKVHFNEVNSIVLLDKDGQIKVRFPAISRGDSHSHKVCSLEIDPEKRLDENSAYVSDVFENNMHVPAIMISVPVYNATEFSGVVRWMITTNRISDLFIRTVAIGKGGYMWMSDSKYNIISHPDKKMVKRNSIDYCRKIIKKFAENNKGRKTKKYCTETEEFLEKMKNTDEGFGSYIDFSNNQYSLAVFKKVVVGTNKWTLVTSIPYHEITGPVIRNALKNYLMGGLISVIIIVIIFIYYSLQKKKTELEMETKYLSEIARSAEELQQERQKRLTAVIDGQELERSRISRELHDGLGQDLLAIKMKLEETVKNGVDHVMTKNINLSVMKAIDETKRISNDLKPVMLEELGIVSAVKNICSEINGSGKLKIDFVTYGIPGNLDQKMQTYIYRICQEGISNIIRHSGATEANIQLLGNDDQISIVIQDDGKGFNPPVALLNGNGLKNIRDRVSIMNGTLDISSNSGEGTILTITIPQKSSI